MPSYPPEQTQPLHVTIFYAVVVAFAIIGVFSTIGFLQHSNQQALLANENTITANVTVSSVSCTGVGCSSLNGFVDSENKGYVINDAFLFSRSDRIVIGHTYSIKYFCNVLFGNDRTVMEMIDHATNPYTCITENGVCK